MGGVVAQAGRCGSSMVARQTVVLQSRVRIRCLPSPQLTANLLVGCHLGWHLAAFWPLWGATEVKIMKMNPGSPKKYKEKTNLQNITNPTKWRGRTKQTGSYYAFWTFLGGQRNVAFLSIIYLSISTISKHISVHGRAGQCTNSAHSDPDVDNNDLIAAACWWRRPPSSCSALIWSWSNLRQAAVQATTSPPLSCSYFSLDFVL
jgi:hypothetical protein